MLVYLGAEGGCSEGREVWMDDRGVWWTCHIHCTSGTDEGGMGATLDIEVAATEMLKIAKDKW